VLDYHAYCIDDANRVVSRHDFVLRDDIAAFEEARELCGEHEVEVWQRTRLVARLAKDGLASRRPLVGPEPERETGQVRTENV
jgi:hypothetical protein